MGDYKDFLDLPNALETQERRKLLGQQLRFLAWKGWHFRRKHIRSALDTVGFFLLSLTLFVLWALLSAMLFLLDMVVLPLATWMLHRLVDGKARLEDYMNKRAG